ncbi:MAG: hypothetical protein ABSF00_07695 [Candidatus Bathyarchaeia archaeon]
MTAKPDQTNQPKKSFWYLSSIQIGLAAAFGAAALAIVLGGLMFPLGPGGLVVDPRMPFAFVGAALTGPIGAIIVGFLAGVGRIPVFNIPFHVIGEVVFFGIGYKYVYKWTKGDLKKIILGFNLLTLPYYFLWETIYWPVVVANFMTKNPSMVIPLYFSYLPGMMVEMVAAMVIQSVILTVLPAKYRRPQW